MMVIDRFRWRKIFCVMHWNMNWMIVMVMTFTVTTDGINSHLSLPHLSKRNILTDELEPLGEVQLREGHGSVLEEAQDNDALVDDLLPFDSV
jgi:hypothetical protein